MGCIASKLRMGNRKRALREYAIHPRQHMREAVRLRHAFIASHAAYIRSLHHIGHVLKQFGEPEHELELADDGNIAVPLDQESEETSNLATPREEGQTSGTATDGNSSHNEASKDLNTSTRRHPRYAIHNSAPPPQPPPPLPFSHSLSTDPPPVLRAASLPSVYLKNITHVSSKEIKGDYILKDITEILEILDELFLSIAESGKKVTKLLEVQKVHYYPNSTDSSGMIDYHQKVLQAMSWKSNSIKSRNGESKKETSVNDDSIEDLSHASILDQLLAWETKLYTQKKVCEVVRRDKENKIARSKSVKSRGSRKSIQKSELAVKALETKHKVESDSIEAIYTEIQRLRDSYLYEILVNLVEGLSTMWNTMYDYHQEQVDLLTANTSKLQLDKSPRKTTHYHRQNTLQLEIELNLWRHNFEMMVATQNDYLGSLYGWLGLKDKNISSTDATKPSPIYHLCQEWHTRLKNLSSNEPLQALKGFSEIIHALVMKQSEELQQKKKWENLQKKLDMKKNLLEKLEKKHSKRVHLSTNEEENPYETIEPREKSASIRETEDALDTLKKEIEVEGEKYDKISLESYNLTKTSLQNGLGMVILAFRNFAFSCSQLYMFAWIS